LFRVEVVLEYIVASFILRAKESPQDRRCAEQMSAEGRNFAMERRVL
jgi:hypothetical protein